MTLLYWLLGALALCEGAVLWQTFCRGPFRFVYNKHIAKLLAYDAATVGARAYVKKPELLEGFGPNGTEPTHLPYNHPLRRWWRHEKQHNRQFRVRPFMAPIYLLWDKIVGYERNPLEDEAEREEGP